MFEIDDDDVQAKHLLGRLADRGVTLWVDNGALKYRGPKDALDADLRQALSERKTSLIQRLSSDQAQIGGRPDFSQTPAIGEVIPIPDHMKHFWAVVRRGEAGLGYTNGSQVVVKLAFAIDDNLLVRAVGDLVRRHEILAARAVSLERQGEDGFICDVHPADIASSSDLSDLGPVEAEQAFDAEMSAFVWEPFELERGMFRVRHFKLPNGRSAIAVVVHHFLVDDVALWRVISELVEFCDVESRGKTYAPPAQAFSFTGYLKGMGAWLNQPEHFLHHRRFWTEAMKGAPSTRLPGRRDLPEDTVSDIVGCRFRIPAGPAGRLDFACRTYGATPFMGVLAITRMVLATLSEQDDIVLTLLSDGRNNGIPPDAVGRFTTILPLRTRCSAVTSFRNALEAVKNPYLLSLQHWACPQYAFYTDVAQVGQAWDAPLINFRDHRARNTPEPEGPERSPLPGGEPPPWRAQLKTYGNMHLSFGWMAQHLGVHVQYPSAVFENAIVDRFCRLFAKTVEHAATEPERTFDLRTFLEPLGAAT